MRTRTPITYATLPVSRSTFEEVSVKLREAGYERTGPRKYDCDYIGGDDLEVDMHGIALVLEVDYVGTEEERVAAGWKELERQRDAARGELGRVDRETGIVDGQIDMAALVRRITVDADRRLSSVLLHGKIQSGQLTPDVTVTVEAEETPDTETWNRIVEVLRSGRCVEVVLR